METPNAELVSLLVTLFWSRRACVNTKSILNYLLPGTVYTIEHLATSRFLFLDDDKKVKDEGGWTNAPSVLGSDANYYNFGLWAVEPAGANDFHIIHVRSNRYLFIGGGNIRVGKCQPLFFV